MGWGRSNWSKKIKLNVWNSMNGMERNEYRTMTCKHILAPISAPDQVPVYFLASRADQEHLYSVAMYWIHIHLYDCTSITYYIYIYVYLHILDLTYQYIYTHIGLHFPWNHPILKSCHLKRKLIFKAPLICVPGRACIDGVVCSRIVKKKQHEPPT